MRVVDPHVHFWNPSKVPVSWLRHPKLAYSGDNRKLPKIFTPETLTSVSGDVEVLKCVHIEANTDNALREAEWVQSMTGNTRMSLGIVAHADLSSPTFSQNLTSMLSHPRFRGIRQILNVHTNAKYAYVSHQYLRDERWLRNLDALGEHHLSFDLQIYPSQAADAARAAERHPSVTFVLNHAGMFVDRNTTIGWRAWTKGLKTLASYPNVVAKISGLAMFDHHWTQESFRPYVLETISTFGISRCMFASNFPIDGLHSTYERLWHTYAGIVSGLTDEERDALFLSNAERVYRI